MNKWQQYQGIYVHIPFCVHKCLYCDFASTAGCDNALMESYTQALCKEITARAAELPVAEDATIYFGGGTPSVLPLPYLTRLVTTLKDVGLWQHPQEATIEANPGTVTEESLEALRQLGFDRISLGIQSLQDDELRAMGRIHTAQEAVEVLRQARQAGFERISGDLIFGYPGQTLASVQSSVRGLLAQGLDHLSVYGLTVEEGTLLQRKLASGTLSLPDDDTVGDMYDFVTTYVPQQGLSRYEISNYARPGQESRHNMLYWRYVPYLGLGAAACTFTGQALVTNSCDIAEYNEGKNRQIENLTQLELAAESLFMGLRTAQGVNLQETKERFGCDTWSRYGRELDQAIHAGLLSYDAASQILRLTAKGMQYGNQVFAIFC